MKLFLASDVDREHASGMRNEITLKMNELRLTVEVRVCKTALPNASGTCSYVAKMWAVAVSLLI